MTSKKLRSAVLIITITTLLSPNLFACTGIRLSTKRHDIIYARTLEFEIDLHSEILFMPRNYTITGTGASGKKNGLAWHTRYAALGLNALGVNDFVDGVNEEGLAGGMFYFPGYGSYKNPAPDEVNKAIAPWQLLTWILTTCATIDEVKNNLPTIIVSSIIEPQMGFVPPFHTIVHEPSGASLVIEYTNNGTLNLYDNPIGVITNAPEFNWHMTNIRNYINLSPTGTPTTRLGPLTLTPLGQGSGFLGLPGDFTPPSRFIRATFLSQAITPVSTPQEAIFQAFHVLNQFDIPKGVVRKKEKENITYDYTQWTSAIDLKNKRLYIRTYDNSQLQMADLMNLDLNAQKPSTIQLAQKPTIINLTPKSHNYVRK